MKQQLITLILLLSLTVLNACSSTTSLVTTDSGPNTEPFNAVGVVVYLDIEGGVYNIQTDTDSYAVIDTNHINIALYEGKTVSISAEELDVATIVMTGTPINLLQISEL